MFLKGWTEASGGQRGEGRTLGKQRKQVSVMTGRTSDIGEGSGNMETCSELTNFFHVTVVIGVL